MNPLLLAVLPLIVTGLTSLIKRLPAVDKTEGTARAVIVRGIAALLSLGGIIAAFMSSGQVPDPNILGDIVLTISLAFMTFLGSIGGHSVFKK